eukprot:8302962-Alexandrium_andersonii.AAC.1
MESFPNPCKVLVAASCVVLPRSLVTLCRGPVWNIYIAGRPKCNPQSAPNPSGLLSASIHNPPC